MKTITNSLQRTYRFMAAILTFIGLVFLISCQKDAVNQDNLIGSAASLKKVKIDKGFARDADGHIYKTVVIGTQTWMAENLRTTKFNDGESIPLVSSDLQWTDVEGWPIHSPAYCYYDYNVKNGTIYGALYDWTAVNTGKLCPTGWHVPTDKEWTTLTDYLGEKASNKLREATDKYWYNNFISEDTYPTNETGFTALPGGTRVVVVVDDGSPVTHTREYFDGLNVASTWWTSSAVENDYYNSWVMYLSGDTKDVVTWPAYRSQASAVRCIMDTN